MVSIRSPTVTTIALFVAVYALQWIASLFGSVVGPTTGLFVLTPPVDKQPWTLVTSVYAHAGLTHLGANALALLVPGIIVERSTTSLRYHLFFVTSGAIAGVVEITAGPLLGSQAAGVLGASGAVFAIIGYLLTSNRLTDTVIGGIELRGRTQLALFTILAVAVTLTTGSPGVALLAHFTGLLLGLLAGRMHLLRADPE
jgi:membrane associated rhomboid family serine protease